MMCTFKKAITFCLFIVSYSVMACDICGLYMGITPYDHKNSISFLHRYRVFNGYRNYQKQSRFFPPSAYKVSHGQQPQDTGILQTQNYSSKDFESYKLVELRCKYFITNRFETNLFIPVLDNKSKKDDLYLHHTGFGDVSLNVAYHIIIPKASQPIRHKLLVGLGMKLPTGNYYAHDANSNRLPFEMQPGTGSYDGFGYINYVVMGKRYGANLNLNYKQNGQNKYREHLGNSHNDILSLFYKFSYQSVIFYPSIQANYEYTKGIYVTHHLQKNTGINSLLLGPGLDLYYQSFSINMGWQFTVMEEVRDGMLKSAGRINIGINYSFSRKEKD